MQFMFHFLQETLPKIPAWISPFTRLQKQVWSVPHDFHFIIHQSCTNALIAPRVIFVYPALGKMEVQPTE